MRLIDADALLECQFKNDISYKALCSLVKRQSTVNAPRWIPCSETLPETNILHQADYMDDWYSSDLVLAYIIEPFGDGLGDKNASQFVLAYYDKDMGNPEIRYGWSEWLTGNPLEVVAWMPLPQPYKDGEACAD